MIGQPEAKWAAEVATAGRHHMLFHGPPGVGKTMIAQRVPGCCPTSPFREALEVSAIHPRRLCAVRRPDHRPPFSDPHHSASARASSAAASEWRSRERFLVHIEGYFSWTRRQSSRLSCWRPYVRRWNQG